jgi:transposase-like protein
LDQRFCRDVLAIAAAKTLAHEADAFAGAPRGARASRRRTRRSGYRWHQWTTCFGEIDIAVPRFRQGSFRSALLVAPKADADAVRTAIREAATTGRSGRLLRLLGSPPLPERSAQALGAEIAHRYLASIRSAATRWAEDTAAIETAVRTAGPADLDEDDRDADLLDPSVYDLEHDYAHSSWVARP